MVASQSCSQADCQGQRSGRCRTSLRAEWASRAGTLMRWARNVAVVARAWKADARHPAARVRLNALTVTTRPGPARHYWP
jgi:hypothetical protein